MSSKTDLSFVDSNLPQMCHVVSDSQWYSDEVSRTDAEALWISHSCSSRVGIIAKQHMRNLGGIYLVESACEPCSRCNRGRVWIQANDVECARLCQKKGVLPSQKRMRRGLAVGLCGHEWSCRRGDLLRTLRFGGCRKGILNWIRHHYVCPVCKSKTIPRPVKPAIVLKCYRFNEHLGVDLVLPQANGVQTWYLNMAHVR
eukprot:3942609-Amphidinium_carterae.2